jgi:hypothetical protein
VSDFFDNKEAFGRALKSGEAPTGEPVRFDAADAEGRYVVRVFNSGIARKLKASYTPDDLRNLTDFTKDLRSIETVTKPWGAFVRAASFSSEETAQSTNYDAVWVRDSVWCCLALKTDPARRGDAIRVLLTLLDYMAAQSHRIDSAIADPASVRAEDGDMKAVHIRFDANAPDFDDVRIDGEPQTWTHKQNDAIGLALDAAFTAYAEGLIEPSDMDDSRMGAVVRLIAYLNAVSFFSMEDSGAWEELPRHNASSVALVVSALERLKDLLARDKGFADAYVRSVHALGLGETADIDAIEEMISQGYKVVRSQLSLGGESPDYSKDDPRYREADAALLNLIYPARLSGLTESDRLRVLDIVGTLIGSYGIRRYFHDNYQSGNFWFQGIKTDADPESHKKREEAYIENSEAEWFFDSWYAKCCRIVSKEPGVANAVRIALEHRAVKHMNRALGQITGEGAFSADGKPVAAFELPESYNRIVLDEGSSFPAPSPIVPLNWAKASLTLLFSEML